MYNSSGAVLARIWRVGTNRILAVTAHELPENVRPLMKEFEDEVIADFLVCPLTKEEPGIMQHVCVESATHLKKVQRKSKSDK